VCVCVCHNTQVVAVEAVPPRPTWPVRRYRAANQALEGGPTVTQTARRALPTTQLR